MAGEEGESDNELKEIKEGKAAVLYPASESVFYNPVQQFNRDLSILTIKEFISVYNKELDEKEASRRHGPKSGKKDITDEEANEHNNVTHGRCIRVLEGLAATGLRSIRYALEIEGIGQIIANDLSKAAVENIKRNVDHNKVGHIIEPSLSDAGLLMYQHKYPASKRFHIIDLDPYGSPASFLDGAVQAIEDGGLLCVTCTDMAGLCGNHGEASFAKYGAMPLKSKCCHEMALRLVLGSIDSHAGRYKRFITPMLSVSADFYIRVFVRVNTSASEVKRSASKKSYVFQCVGCDSFHLQPVGKRIEEGNRRKYNPATGPVIGEACKECGQRFQIGGPIWSEPIHDRGFVEALLTRLANEKDAYGTAHRLQGMLMVISEELEDSPLYYVIDKLANVIHCSVPSMLQIRSALISLGFKVSSTHATSNGLKTDAPNSVIWDVLRCWEKEHPVAEKKRSGRSPAAVILSKEPKIVASFAILEEANPKSRKMKVARFPENPEPDWGPKARAKGTTKFTSLAEKRKQLQGKKTRRKDDSDGTLTKKFPCKRFRMGLCRLASEDCRYHHEEIAAAKMDESEDKISSVEVFKNSDFLVKNDS